jgi:hypothetical protein
VSEISDGPRLSDKSDTSASKVLLERVFLERDATIETGWHDKNQENGFVTKIAIRACLGREMRPSDLSGSDFCRRARLGWEAKGLVFFGEKSCIF